VKAFTYGVVLSWLLWLPSGRPRERCKRGLGTANQARRQEGGEPRASQALAASHSGELLLSLPKQAAAIAGHTSERVGVGERNQGVCGAMAAGSALLGGRCLLNTHDCVGSTTIIGGRLSYAPECPFDGILSTYPTCPALAGGAFRRNAPLCPALDSQREDINRVPRAAPALQHFLPLEGRGHRCDIGPSWPSSPTARQEIGYSHS
jgi:hypothetical protein